MNLDPDTPRRVIAILEQPALEDFAALMALSGLDPAQDFRRANLRNVAFGAAELSGYDFSGADLTGADLSRARGRHPFDRPPRSPRTSTRGAKRVPVAAISW